jgi:hypothetical protein
VRKTWQVLGSSLAHKYSQKHKLCILPSGRLSNQTVFDTPVSHQWHEIVLSTCHVMVKWPWTFLTVVPFNNTGLTTVIHSQPRSCDNRGPFRQHKFLGKIWMLFCSTIWTILFDGDGNWIFLDSKCKLAGDWPILSTLCGVLLVYETPTYMSLVALFTGQL